MILCGSVAALLGFGAHAANQVWDGGSLVDGMWSDIANWLGGAPPGSTGGVTTSTDVATFNTPITNTWGDASANPVVIDSATQNIGGINFDTASDNYFIGSTGGNPLLVSSGGAIQILSTLTATNAVETINAPLQIQSAGGAYTLANNSNSGSGAGAGTLNFGGGITGAGGGATVLTLSGKNTNANTISGVIGNGTATTLGVTKTGIGAWTLTGANTYTGATIVNGGTLILDATQVPATLAATPVTFGGGALVFKGDGAGTGFTVGSVTLANGGVGSSLQLIGGANGTTLALGSVPTTYTIGTTATVNIAVSGANSSVTTTTTASQWTNETADTGEYTFTRGGVTSFATLTTNNANNALSGSVITTPLPASGSNAEADYILTGSQTISSLEHIHNLQLNATTGNSTLSIGASDFYISSGLLNTSSSQFTITSTSGGIIVNTGVNASGGSVLYVHNFGTGGLIFNAQVLGYDDGGGLIVAFDGPGTTTLGSKFSAEIEAGGGAVLNVSSSNNFSTASTPILLNGATLQFGASFSLLHPVTLDANGGTFDTQTFTLTAQQGISGAGSLTKIGSGTLSLANTNTYTGATTVSAGTLLVSGSISGSTTTVSGSGTLSGSGGTTGAVIVNSGGALAPGTSASTGTLKTADVTLTGAAAFHLSLNTSTPSASQVIATGNLSLDLANTTTLSLTDLGANLALSPGMVFPFLDYSGTWNGGIFSGMPNDSTFTFGANQFEIMYNGVDSGNGGMNAVTLTVLAVPEPGSVALLGMGALALAKFTRARKKLTKRKTSH